jgi:hypothetical protein
VPTADEIAQVTALGFSEFMATHAIRMAEFNCTVAVEILLTNEPGIMAFIEQQNVAKIEEQKQKEKEKSDESNSDSVKPSEVPQCSPLITIEEFKSKVNDNVIPRVFEILFSCTLDSVIDQSIGLKMLRRLSKSQITK